MAFWDRPKRPCTIGDRSKGTARNSRPAFYAEHRLNAAAVRAGVVALGLELFGEDPASAVAVTPVRVPEGLDADEVADHLRERHGIVTAPGQGPLRGTILRLGRLGHVAAADVVTGLAALAATLAEFGRPAPGGDAVAAAVGVYRAAGAWPR